MFGVFWKGPFGGSVPHQGPSDKGKGKGTGKDKAKGKEGTDPKIAAAAASSTTAPPPSTSTSPTTSIPPEIKALLADTREMLSALNSEPAMKPLKVEDLSIQKAQTLLLDSGATHLLRQAKDKSELDRASPVVVTLAGDEGKVLKSLKSWDARSHGPRAFARLFIPP